MWLWWDELERAKEAFEWLIGRARDMGDEGSLPYILVLAAQVECVRGDLALAAAHADEGYELTEQTGQATVGAYLLALRALAHAAAGEDGWPRASGPSAPSQSRTARVAGPRSTSPWPRSASSSSRSGEPPRRRRCSRPLVAFLRREQIREPGTARVVPNYVEALIGLGELDAALSCSTGTRTTREQLGALPRRWLPRLAAAACCTPSAATSRPRSQQLERAVDLSGEVPNPLEHGRALLAHGAVHRRARHKRAARESLEAALAVFEGMGARSGRSERVRSSGAWAAGARLGRELTPTELRVAELVAEGLQTKQVAAALFVSPKTVEGHLTQHLREAGRALTHGACPPTHAELARMGTLVPPTDS